jgi:tetratricopeptide (TPR) repeat protein
MYQLLITTILAGPPALPPETSHSLSEQPVAGTLEDARSLYEAGSVLYDAADYLGAIDKFTEALGIVKRLGGHDEVRLSLLYNIAASHEKQFEIDKDVSHLRQALALYRQYEEFVSGGDLGDELDVHGKILNLERRLNTHDNIERNRANSKMEPRDIPPPPTSNGWERHRKTGVGLAVSGGVFLVGGVILSVVGSQFEPSARAQVDELADLGVPMDHPAWAQGDEFIEQERRKGVALMAVGGSLAVVGVVGVGVGTFFLVKAKRARAGQASVSPTLGRGFAGVQLTGRF